MLEDDDLDASPSDEHWGGDSEVEEMARLMGIDQYGSMVGKLSPSDIAKLREGL